MAEFTEPIEPILDDFLTGNDSTFIIMSNYILDDFLTENNTFISMCIELENNNTSFIINNRTSTLHMSWG